MLLRDNTQFICDDCGLGKTATVIVATLQRNLYPILIVVPASLKLNWKEEFRKWGNRDVVIDDVSQDIVIINYESLQKHKYDLYDRNFKQVIFDECHVLKNSTAKRAKIALELSKRIPYKILMTATPILNRPVELWSQIEILGWQRRFKDKQTFLDTYCGKHETRYGVQYQGFANLGELKKKLSKMIIRRTKNDLESKLPEKHVIEVPLIRVPQLPPTSFQQIERMDKTVLKAKMKLSIDFIQTKLDENEQVVVFVHHRDIGEKLRKAFPTASVIVGGQKAEEREQNVRDFQGGRTQLIICSLQASAVGLTLTSARIAVFIEYPWSPTLLQQAQDRIHRLSQTRDCFIYYLYAKDSIDEYRLNMNTTKKSIIDYIMEDNE